jgi:hypothetical protein
MQRPWMSLRRVLARVPATTPVAATRVVQRSCDHTCRCGACLLAFLRLHLSLRPVLGHVAPTQPMMDPNGRVPLKTDKASKLDTTRQCWAAEKLHGCTRSRASRIVPG